MSSKKQLKKEINNTLGALIEEVYVKELSSPEVDVKKSEKIIDEAIGLFDELIQQIHEPAAKETPKKNFKAIRASLKDKAAALSDKIEKL